MQIRFLSAFVLLFFFYASHAQEGEILVDGVALDLREPMTSCFQFAPFKAKLTGEGADGKKQPDYRFRPWCFAGGKTATSRPCDAAGKGCASLFVEEK